MSFKPDIDLKTGKMDEPVALRGEPEFLATDSAGKVYINLMDTNEVAVVDFKTRKVVAHWPVAPGGQPVGMAIEPRAGRLFIGCRGPQKLIVMSTENGQVLSDMPIGGIENNPVHIGQRGERAQYRVRFQIEDDDRSVASAVADESPPGRRGNGHTVGVLLSWNVGQGFSALAVDDQGVRGARNVQPVRLGIDGQIIPSAGTTDLKRLDDLPVCLREKRNGGEEECEKSHLIIVLFYPWWLRRK